MSCYEERVEILKVKDEHREEFEDFYYGRYENIKADFLKEYLEEISDVKGYSAKINKIGGADYTVHSSDFDHTYYKDGYFIYGHYFNINNYEWSLLGNLLGDISRYMCDLIYGEYYEELLFNIGRNPYSCVDNTKEYGFKNYRDALEQLGYFESKVSDD